MNRNLFIYLLVILVVYGVAIAYLQDEPIYVLSVLVFVPVIAVIVFTSLYVWTVGDDYTLHTHFYPDDGTTDNVVVTATSNGRSVEMNVYEQLITKKAKLSLIGLGYVGMPICAFP